MPHAEIKLTAKSQVQLRSVNSPILWQQSLTDKKMYSFSFGGTQIKSSSSSLLKLVKSLNAGTACVVGTSLKGPLQKQDIQSLQALANAGAIQNL